MIIHKPIVPYREHFQQEDGHILSQEDFAKFNPGRLSKEDYTKVHALMSLVCHDAIVNYQGKALLAYRREKPAQGVLSPLGGRLSKGVPLEKSLRDKIRGESGLEMEGLTLLGSQRVVWGEDPLGHGKGTDTFTYMFYGLGIGEIKLDKTLENQALLSPEQYTPEYRKNLHTYTQDFLDAVMPLITQDSR